MSDSRVNELTSQQFTNVDVAMEIGLFAGGKSRASKQSIEDVVPTLALGHEPEGRSLSPRCQFECGFLHHPNHNSDPHWDTGEPNAHSKILKINLTYSPPPAVS